MCSGKIKKFENEVTEAKNQADIFRKEKLVLQKESEMFNSQIEFANAARDRATARATLLESEVQELRREVVRTKRPLHVNAATQTDNRREEQLMDLMKTFDPKVLQGAFEAELKLEKEKSTWLSGQLSHTRQMLKSLAEHVNETSSFATNGYHGIKKPRFMRNTKSTEGRLRTNIRRKSLATASRRANNHRGHQNIHRILQAANNVSKYSRLDTYMLFHI